MSRTIDYRRIEMLEPEVVEMLRGKTAAEKVEMVFDAEKTLRMMLEAHLKWSHPNWSDEQVRQEIARRWLREGMGEGAGTQIVFDSSGRACVVFCR